MTGRKVFAIPAVTIAEDYVLSACFYVHSDLMRFPTLTGVYDRETIGEYQLHHCRPGSMLELIHHVEERYGGIKAYALNGGLTQKQIEIRRSALVE